MLSPQIRSRIKIPIWDLRKRMTLHAIDSLVLFLYCCTAQSKRSQVHTRALRRQLACSLCTACSGTALCVTLPDAAWKPEWAIVSTWVCGILARSQIRCLDLVSRKASGWPSKGSLDRMLSASRQMMNIQQGRANPFPCILPQEETHFLPAMLGSTACIRQFWDETFLGERMSRQMLSAGNLLKSQLVRGYRSCSVEHSWFTQNGLKMQLSKMCFTKLFNALK